MPTHLVQNCSYDQVMRQPPLGNQVLLTNFFGLATTRVDVKERQMKELTLKARSGNNEAATQLLNLWSKGLEGVNA